MISKIIGDIWTLYMTKKLISVNLRNFTLHPARQPTIWFWSKFIVFFVNLKTKLDFCFEARDKTSSIDMIRIILFDICWSCLVVMIFSSLSPTDSWRNRNYEVRVRSIHVYFCYNHSEQSKCTLDKSPAATRSSLLLGCRWWSSPSAAQRAHAECDD